MTVFIGAAGFAAVLLIWLLIFRTTAQEIWNALPPWFRWTVATIFAIALLIAGGGLLSPG